MKINFLFFFIFCLNQLFCQKNDTVADVLRLENYIKLQYDNDFFSATDRYYTQGIQFSFINKFSSPNNSLIPIVFNLNN